MIKLAASSIRRLSTASTRDIIRPHWYVSQFDNRGTIERARPDDSEILSQFLSKGFASCEPVTVGLGVSEDLMQNYFSEQIKDSLKSEYTLLAFYLNKLVGALVAKDLLIDHLVPNVMEAEILSDYRKEIDQVMSSGCPDRRLARLKVYYEKWVRIAPNFLCHKTKKVLHLQYGYILPEYRGALLSKLLLEDVLNLANQNKITQFMTVCTSVPSSKNYENIADVKYVFPYKNFVDSGEKVLPDKSKMLHHSEMAFLAIGNTDITMEDEEEKPPQPVYKATNLSSLYSLRSEVIKRKNIAKAKSSAVTVDISKKSIFTINKKDKQLKEENKKQRQERINKLSAELKKEEEDATRRKKVLEEKAKIYERLTSGEQLVNEDGRDVDFLVNFNVKKRELEEEREREKEKNEQKDEPEDLPQTSTPLVDRYNPLEEPGRLFGPSHAFLPTNEEDRVNKIKEIKDMSKQTEATRQKRKKLLSDKKRMDREKLKKFRARMNLSPLPSTSEESEEETTEAEPQYLDIPLPPEPVPSKSNQTSYGIREWDEGKYYRKWKEEQEQKRDEEFAPPSSYYR
ncbi:unnamed protein product [Bursaphelenchus okinawaensis]|uniref:N-acetyltransferase domain-containing protein n=1 Tax=Bursaphelenchus okinawaensis TaxID=465554 RepID=A0A811K8G1_9BILA|nr:unnamed protein product [Bursaphelenchus okinawaensis]CAG9093861.1 unnamed protein product [Bursaphelenchus okinawaensis]